MLKNASWHQTGDWFYWCHFTDDKVKALNVMMVAGVIPRVSRNWDTLWVGDMANGEVRQQDLASVRENTVHTLPTTTVWNFLDWFAWWWVVPLPWLYLPPCLNTLSCRICWPKLPLIILNRYPVTGIWQEDSSQGITYQPYKQRTWSLSRQVSQHHLWWSLPSQRAGTVSSFDHLPHEASKGNRQVYYWRGLFKIKSS